MIYNWLHYYKQAAELSEEELERRFKRDISSDLKAAFINDILEENADKQIQEDEELIEKFIGPKSHKNIFKGGPTLKYVVEEALEKAIPSSSGFDKDRPAFFTSPDDYWKFYSPEGKLPYKPSKNTKKKY